MILDEFVEFADATALDGTVAGTPLVLGDVIDIRAVEGGATPALGANVLQNIGAQPIYLVIVASALIDLAVTSTLEFQLASDSTADLATTPTIHLRSESFTADIAAGTTILATPIPHDDYEQFVGILEDVGTADLTAAGSVNAFLTLDASRWTAYADSPNVV